MSTKTVVVSCAGGIGIVVGRDRKRPSKVVVEILHSTQGAVETFQSFDPSQLAPFQLETAGQAINAAVSKALAEKVGNLMAAYNRQKEIADQATKKVLDQQALLRHHEEAAKIRCP
jgi:hypothetical protein